MSAWDLYGERVNVMGSTKRQSAKRLESLRIHKKIPDNLSYQNVVMRPGEAGYWVMGEDPYAGAFEQQVAIINSDNLDEKYLFSLPGDDIAGGTLVDWMDNKWLVTEKDANTTMYTRCKMIQLNYPVRWIGKDKQIYEQWCRIEDGTKYLTGELEDWLIKHKSAYTAMCLNNDLPNCWDTLRA